MDDEDLIIRIPARLVRELMAKPARASRPRSDEDRAWSDPQKRLLYRLLHTQGFSGTTARRQIEKRLGLGEGDTPSMSEASRLIDALKGEQEGGSRGAA